MGLSKYYAKKHGNNSCVITTPPHYTGGVLVKSVEQKAGGYGILPNVMHTKHVWEFEAIGTRFTITVWDGRTREECTGAIDACIALADDFDTRYSRFKPDSLVTVLSTTTGTFEVPSELTNMLRLYERLHESTQGAINPAVGFALSDSGYDAEYSLVPHKTVRVTPPLHDCLRILDNTHIELLRPTLLDLGALGKGYLVDSIYELLLSKGYTRFLVDGSGDIRYVSSNGEPITCGLEHPQDVTLAIGTLELRSGTLCASAVNRRVWKDRNHYIDPTTGQSPHDVLATWVTAETAALADGLASALFFVTPESLHTYTFEYLIVNKELTLKKSAGFTADLFTT